MIIECKSCGKKFNVPDQAITTNGRLVQCSSCGHKWTQFPVKQKIKKPPTKPVLVKLGDKRPKPKKKIKKNEGPTIYSSEYLEKKHGIKIQSSEKTSSKKYKKAQRENVNIGIGFYGWLIILVIFVIGILGILNLTQDIIIFYFPFLESYLTYLFETLYNLKEIFSDFFSNY